MFCGNVSDDGWGAGVWGVSQRSKDGFRLFLRGDDDHGSLAGEIERFQSQHPADSLHRRRNGHRGRIQFHTHPAFRGNFMQDSPDTTARRIPNDMRTRASQKERMHRTPEGRTIAGNFCLYSKVVAGKKDGASMPANVSRDDDGVSRLCELA